MFRFPYHRLLNTKYINIFNILKLKTKPSDSWIIAIVTLLFTCISVIISINKPPKFIIEKFILKSDAALIIKANNSKANRKKNLDIIFDGFPFPKKGILIESTDGMQHWSFSLKKYTNHSLLTKDGEHKVIMGFPGEKLSDEYKIIFISKPPIVKVIKSHDQGQTKIKGNVTTELQIPKNILAVDITYFHDGKECKIKKIPLTKKIHPETGIVYYEFETILQGLPNLKPDDPRYTELFWLIEVTDQAGNQYYHKQSYAKFMAPGDDQIGVGNIASIKIEKISEDIQLRNIVRIVPNQTLVNILPNGEPPIELSVKAVGKSAKLQWRYNIDNIEPITLVFKNDKKIGASASNEYIDYSAKINAKYRVEQRNNNIIYSSYEKMIETEQIVKNSSEHQDILNQSRKRQDMINHNQTTNSQDKINQAIESQRVIDRALERQRIIDRALESQRIIDQAIKNQKIVDQAIKNQKIVDQSIESQHSKD